MSLKAVIYDLDGVITNTSNYQYEAWKWVADQLDYNLTPKQNQKLVGMGHKESLERVIKWSGNRISEADKQSLLSQKNKLYLELIDGMSPEEVFDGFRYFNQGVKAEGIKVAVASSSKNAIRIIDKLDLVLAFHAIVDGGMVENTKPEPDVLLQAAEKMQILPEECLVIESSQAGLTAAKKAGMKAAYLGNDRGMKGALLSIKSWQDADLKKIQSLF